MFEVFALKKKHKSCWRKEKTKETIVLLENYFKLILELLKKI